MSLPVLRDLARRRTHGPGGDAVRTQHVRAAHRHATSLSSLPPPAPSAIRLRSMPSSWEETKLWAAIAERTEASDAAVAAVTADVMALLQAVAAADGDAESALTWHDPNHALQVAELMCDVVSAEGLERLSSHELALLLLAAYAHDLGQTSLVARSSAHYAYLLSGEGDLSQPERVDLQRWLDREERGLEPPIRGRDSEMLTTAYRVSSKRLAQTPRTDTRLRPSVVAGAAPRATGARDPSPGKAERWSGGRTDSARYALADYKVRT